jgi:hypothetical protein
MLEKNNGGFHAISGTWVVPRASQHTKGQAENSAVWVGIGGGCVDSGCTITDNTLIQAGTEQDVGKNGKTSYSAWWEEIPNTSQTITNFPVRPGDRITVTIAEHSPNSEAWTITLRNLSNGRHWTTSTNYPSSYASAEWILETPLVVGTGGAGEANMPNLSRVHFTNATANGKNAGLLRSERMVLIGSSNKVIASPSAPGASRNDFNDCTFITTCPAP